MTNGERPNWVEARGNCTLEGTFEQIMASIRYDVKCFDKMHERKPRDRTIGFENGCLHKATVWSRKAGPTPVDDTVSVHIAGQCIRVCRNREHLFTVDREWNEQTLTCDLKISGEVYSLWQISQKAIGDLLFG
ncbi:MAG: hypothetical protein F4Z14_00560 [Gammaproteobacteria bacterium]|nr:hypothetical protein [Gammaproteobacteria bacterium]